MWIAVVIFFILIFYTFWSSASYMKNFLMLYIKVARLDFLGGYLPSLSINYVAMSKDMEKRSPQLQVFWHQSEARMAATVWNWSGKTLSPGALLAVLYFSSFHIYFSARLDFPSPPLSAPGSPRMHYVKLN